MNQDHVQEIVNVCAFSESNYIHMKRKCTNNIRSGMHSLCYSLNFNKLVYLLKNYLKVIKNNLGYALHISIIHIIIFECAYCTKYILCTKSTAKSLWVFRMTLKFKRTFEAIIIMI